MPDLEAFVAKIRSANDYLTLKDLLIQVLGKSPPEITPALKVRLASILRDKQYTETGKAAGHKKALEAIDTKYKNLAIILSSHKDAKIVPKANLPVKGGSGAGGLGAFVLKNWFASRKKQIIGVGLLGGVVGALAFVYNRWYKKDSIPEVRVNPAGKKLESLERTMLALHKLKALSSLGKSGDLDDYQEFLDGSKMSAKKRKALPPKKDKEKGINWDKEESSLMGSVEKASKAISHAKPRELDVPLLISGNTSSLFDPPAEPKKRRKRKPKETSEETNPDTPLIEDHDDSSDNFSDDLNESSETSELDSDSDDDSNEIHLIPVVKRSKKVKNL